MAHPMKFAKDYLDFDPAEAEARSGLPPAKVDPVAVARQAGACWQDAKQPDLFYRPARPGEGDGVYMARVTETGLSEWEYRSYYEPPSAVVI